MPDNTFQTPLVLWPRLASAWPAWPRPAQRRLLREAAQTLHRLWQDGCDVRQLPLDLWAVREPLGNASIQLPPGPLPRRGRPLPPAALLDVLAEWYEQTDIVLPARDQFYFLRNFYSHESVDGPAIRYMAREIKRMGCERLARRAKALYKRHLVGPQHAGDRQGKLGLWAPDPAVRAYDLHAALTALEGDARARVIKQHDAICVMRASLFGHDALVKRYDLAGPIERLKYRFRPSRARRAWAAAKTLLQMGIPTPEPLGYLEIFSRRVPVRSYIITRFIDDSTTAHQWIKLRYAQLPQEEKNALGRMLLRQLLLLHRRAIYHADTKSLNLLIQHPDDPASRTLYWIDLECVQAGVLPTRHQIVRNLVQLNGSVRTWVGVEDRMAFLRQVARVYPWVLRPAVVRRIRRWTRRRLAKEARLQCGP